MDVYTLILVETLFGLIYMIWKWECSDS